MKKGQIGALPAVIIGLLVVAVLGVVLVQVTDVVIEPFVDTEFHDNESRVLSNVSAAGNIWTNNFSCCNKDGWQIDSVQIFNTTTECAGGCNTSEYNVSYSDCAVSLNNSLGLQNGSYAVDYTCYPAMYQNNTAVRTMFDLVPISLAAVVIIVILVGLITMVAMR